MKGFFASKTGNTILGIILAVVIFVLLNVIFGLGGALGGAIAGGIGFGAAAAIGRNTKKDEPQEVSAENNEVIVEEIGHKEVVSDNADENLDETEETNNEENI